MPTAYGLPMDADALMMLRDATDGSLDASETGGDIRLEGTPQDGLTLKIVVPSFSSSNTTTHFSSAFRIRVEASATTTYYQTIAATPAIAGPGDYMLRFGVWPPDPWAHIRYMADVAGTMDAGEVTIGIIGHGTKFPDDSISECWANLFEDGLAGTVQA